MFTDLYLKFPDYETAQQHLPILQALTEDIIEIGALGDSSDYHVNARLRGTPPWPQELAPFVLTPQYPKVKWYDGNSE